MKIHDLEQEIMNCWNVCDDIDMVTVHFVDSPEWESIDGKLCDALTNKYLGLKEVYDLKFKKLWDTFESHVKEYHQIKKQDES